MLSVREPLKSIEQKRPAGSDPRESRILPTGRAILGYGSAPCDSARQGAYPMFNLNRAAISLTRVLQASAAGSLALLVLVAFVL